MKISYKTLEKIYLLFVVVFSGFATNYYIENNGIIFFFILNILFALIFKITFNKKDLLFFIAVALFLGIQWILFKSITPFFFLRNINVILCSFIVLKRFGYKFLFEYERIIYFLVVVSLFFWSWEMINPSSLIKLFSLLDYSNGIFSNRPIYYHFLFYTVDYSTDILFQRNSGFCWEPGPYAVYIVLGIFAHILTNKKINFKRISIFLAGLITTFSTTGYLALSVIIFSILLKNAKGINKAVISIVVLLLFTFMFFELPFMYQKIVYLFNTGMDVDDNIIDASVETGDSYSSGRFGGMLIAYNDFVKYPIYGIGGNQELSYSKSQGALVNNPSGLCSIISNFGITGFIFFISNFYFSSKKISKTYSFSNQNVLMIILIIAFFSFNFQLQPFIGAFVFYACFIKAEKIEYKGNR